VLHPLAFPAKQQCSWRAPFAG